MSLAGRSTAFMPVGMGLAGLANGAFFVGAGAAAVTVIPEERTSTAGASLSVARHLGSAFGIAVFGALATLVTRARFGSAGAGSPDAAGKVSSVSFGAAPEGVDAAVAAAHSDASLAAFPVVMIVIGACALAAGARAARSLLPRAGHGGSGRRSAARSLTGAPSLPPGHRDETRSPPTAVPRPSREGMLAYGYEG